MSSETVKAYNVILLITLLLFKVGVQKNIFPIKESLLGYIFKN